MSAKLFTVIVVDWDGIVTRDEFRRCMASLAAQTCDDFDVLVYHDGPKATDYAADMAGHPAPASVRYVVTEPRVGDYGHTNRDRAIRAATGEWLLITNADNLFYPTLIERLKATALDPAPLVVGHSKRKPILLKSLWKRLDRWFGTRYLEPYAPDLAERPGQRQIIVYAVILRGMFPYRDAWLRKAGYAAKGGVIVSGIPVVPGNIDAMQLVMRRDLWLAEGGWSDRSMNSDGPLYQGFARKYHVTSLPEVLGEHF